MIKLAIAEFAVIFPTTSEALAVKIAPLPPHFDVEAAHLRNRFHDAISRGLQAGIGVGNSIVSAADVRTQLQFNDDLLGCTAGVCLEATAKAVGADRLVMAELAIFGKNYTISLRAIDVNGNEVANISERCEICSVREADETIAQVASRLAPLIVASAAKVESVVKSPSVESAVRPPSPIIEPVVKASPTIVELSAGSTHLSSGGWTRTQPKRSNHYFHYGWIASLVVGGAVVGGSIPFFVFATKDNQITCATGNIRSCPTIYKGNTEAGAALMGVGAAIGGIGFGILYYLDRREQIRADGQIGSTSVLTSAAGDY